MLLENVSNFYLGFLANQTNLIVIILLENMQVKILGALYWLLSKFYNLGPIQGWGFEKMKKYPKTFVGLYFSTNIYLKNVEMKKIE